MNTSMLPVSGAEQLNTSEAHPIWPISSASGAYSRLVNPAPRNSSSSCEFGGMNMFQRPSARGLSGFSHPGARNLSVFMQFGREEHVQEAWASALFLQISRDRDPLPARPSL